MQFSTSRQFGDAATLLSLPDGEAGVAATLRLMSQLTEQGKKTLAVRNKAVELTNGLRQKDWVGEVRRLHEFVRDGIRYVKDIRNVETLHTAPVVLSQRAGDCDDKCILLASMLESIHHPTRFVALGFGNPPKFSHVIVETLIGQKWVPLETTEPVAVGWYPPRVTARKVVHN